MNLSESFFTAIDSLLANKLRAVLTMLGIIIGVAAVIALMGLGNGFSTYISGEISSIGTNLIFVVTNRENSGGYPALSLRDVNALSEPGSVPSVTQFSASVQGGYEILYGGRSSQASVLGVSGNYMPMNNLTEVLTGGVLTQEDIDTRARVAVIGFILAEELFVDTFALGENIRINGVSYEVIGVLSEKGDGIGGNPDEQVYIPLSTAHSRLFTSRTRKGDRAVSTITAQAVSAEANDLALEEISEVLRAEHGIIYADSDDFQLISQKDLLSTFTSIIGTLTIFLGAIASISLTVGGIGIMNIMLVSVTERTREIGIRKSMGALRRDILIQFLIESLVLCLIGGLIGITLGWSISMLAGRALSLTPGISLGVILLAVGFSMFVGVVFGIYPAWRAARLNPIDALRYE